MYTLGAQNHGENESGLPGWFWGLGIYRALRSGLNSLTLWDAVSRAFILFLALCTSPFLASVFNLVLVPVWIPVSRILLKLCS